MQSTCTALRKSVGDSHLERLSHACLISSFESGGPASSSMNSTTSIGSFSHAESIHLSRSSLGCGCVGVAFGFSLDIRALVAFGSLSLAHSVMCAAMGACPMQRMWYCLVRVQESGDTCFLCAQDQITLDSTANQVRPLRLAPNLVSRKLAQRLRLIGKVRLAYRRGPPPPMPPV